MRSFLLWFIGGLFTFADNRRRLRGAFKRLKQSEQLDDILDEAETLIHSRLRYAIGLPFNWNYRTSGRLGGFANAVLVAFVMPVVYVGAAIFFFIKGDLEAFAIIALMGFLMTIVMVDMAFTSNLSAEGDSDASFFRAWLLVHYRSAGNVPGSIEDLETDLIDFVQPQDPAEFRQRIAPVRRWSKRFFIAGSLVLVGSFVADAIGIFAVGNDFSLVFLFGSIGLFVLGGTDMWYEDHRIPILMDPSGAALPTRRYGNGVPALEDEELMSAYNSVIVTTIVRMYALILEVFGAPFAWEQIGLGIASTTMLAVYGLAALTGGNVVLHDPEFPLGLICGVSLFFCLIIRNWRKVGLREALRRRRLYHRLARIKTLGEVISSDQLLDRYHFGDGENSEFNEQQILTRLLALWAESFRKPPFLLPTDDRGPSGSVMGNQQSHI